MWVVRPGEPAARATRCASAVNANRVDPAPNNRLRSITIMATLLRSRHAIAPPLASGERNVIGRRSHREGAAYSHANNFSNKRASYSADQRLLDAIPFVSAHDFERLPPALSTRAFEKQRHLPIG